MLHWHHHQLQPRQCKPYANYAVTNNVQEVERRCKLQIPVEFIKNAALHAKHFSHRTSTLTTANQCQSVWDHLHNNHICI